ncbi:MAG: UDP-3-O-(3-hydroxymyristoyl)glucosamine N-acyltransferase [Candidatus Omnitrophica bacterium CG11_big_fil_rev_8_21_14_0_20_45_26]|uniref:UDP-3-O-acylglucosamine N-acyltransferase n=1 Tax=Candidatus Abzuiibacterium crystallinum TaxID=1974748 RepID=A0A2H0LLD2_9BACT|nr:MAG: UDP-3-O-(3-hydroxymyristoyl)glucosamine N-acyltransferase [Candidatus Omnitrophica bacterium CG11_big_fil_rev_8_21_14_0_20_45_26]PIW65382.1 MAG: UDP-3-O-(3-hydroxymyristoyl)glucosamine N-acyltransferase [Candidatus Omnitrophica bacterium CG12_big_fil_rev_8_21_14_0_65_45_16]
MSHSIEMLAKQVGGKVIGDGSALIEGITNIESPKAGNITFISHKKSLKELEESPIACIIVPPEVTQSAKPLIQVAQPKLAFAILLSVFYPPRQLHHGISSQAHISKSAKIGKNVTIEPFASIGDRASIEDNTVIRNHVFIDEDVVIGSDTIIHPNVSIYAKCQIGSHVIIHSGVVIGSDGFGFVFDGKAQQKVPQVGIVVIEDYVEIGACTTIDRAAIGKTSVGTGTKIDNLVQIAHNVQIGAHCAISAQCGISGSSKIGNYCTLGGSVGIADHVEIGDGVMLGANAGVPPGKKIPSKQIWFGQPARPYDEMRKQFGAQLRAHENQTELRALKKKVEELTRELSDLKSSMKS